MNASHMQDAGDPFRRTFQFGALRRPAFVCQDQSLSNLPKIAIRILERLLQLGDQRRRRFIGDEMARQLLRDPYWPLRAAAELKGEVPWPNQYLRARV